MEVAYPPLDIRGCINIYTCQLLGWGLCNKVHVSTIAGFYRYKPYDDPHLRALYSSPMGCIDLGSQEAAGDQILFDQNRKLRLGSSHGEWR